MKRIIAIILSLTLLMGAFGPMTVLAATSEDAVMRLVVPENWEMCIGDSRTVDCAMSGTENRMLTWTAEPADVAKVDSWGRVTALKEGEAVITAKNDEGLTDSVTLKVVVEPTKIAEKAEKVDYTLGAVAEGDNLQKVVTRYELDDKNVPANLLQKIVFNVAMYSKQDFYEGQLNKLGLLDENAFTCACYMDEVGNKPARGEVLSWAESSAVVYANSVLGARCNRNSGIIDIMGSVAGYVPHFGLLTDEGRRATWIVEVKTTKKPEAQLLGSAIGMKVMEDVPYIKGLDKWLGDTLDDAACTYLKDFGAATASNGAVGLYHVENLTPEAKDMGESLITDDAKVYVIDDAELQRVYDSYPVIWKNPDAKPKLCFIGCPHMSLQQLQDWTVAVEEGLKAAGHDKVQIPTVFTTAPSVKEVFEQTPYAARLKATGVILSYICPLMYMNNPLAGKMPVITCSNKLRTYTTARFYTEEEILVKITRGGK